MSNHSSEERVPGSFRDPSGFLFVRDGELYRQVNSIYRPHYDRLMQSGLYEELVTAGLLIPHREVAVPPLEADGASCVLQPERVPFIAYPYEWCFSQFQDAALTTLAIMRRALARGMWLKDASAYNIQFYEGRPVLIDTLSFEAYPEGRPWPAYRQFCQHFLAPVLLMSRRDVRLGQFARLFVDGVPLDLASALLPRVTYALPGPLVHVHLHARAIARLARRFDAHRGRRMTRFALEALCDSLEATVRRARYQRRGTEWGAYYAATNYSSDAFAAKKQCVDTWVQRVQAHVVWDLGANDGTFSRLASDRGVFTVAFDVDPTAVENGYRGVRQRKDKHLLPLLLDLTNPSPATGWDNAERPRWCDRGQPDLVLALALIHHLAIGNNIPMLALARFFADLAPCLIVEFVPKGDSQVQHMLSTRADVYTGYSQTQFEAAFNVCFEIIERRPVHESERSLYLMKRR